MSAFGNRNKAMSALPFNQSNHTTRKKDDYEFVGLPYGPKARLILAHINSEAIRTQSKSINVEDSMSAFIKCIGLNLDGRTINEVKSQLRRLTASTLSLGYADNEKGVQVDLKIVKAFDLWFPKDERQRVLWPTNVQLTDDYFNSLVNHAIPLDERALAALSHSAMALDIYAWLVQRLHRINPKEPQFLTWKALKEQFGRGYNQMYKFKQIFRKTLALARSQYPSACIFEDKNEGFWLHHSPSPIEKKTIVALGQHFIHVKFGRVSKLTPRNLVKFGICHPKIVKFGINL
ncbi:MAG: hypothetical protein IPK76_11065 [Lewinellaceae bacterium]|nr:hypothetical protein [Lewinellaceae bacterium]